MFYLIAKNFSVDLYAGRASIKYYGTTAFRSPTISMHCMTVTPTLSKEAETEARKLESEYFAELVKENKALREELAQLKQEAA